jgi:hypothetical protein
VSISDKDRKILWGRSGNRCVLCRRVLIAERTPADREAVVGDEAHIAARSPGGPRYGECPPNMVDSYENLMLLCRDDHKKIDDQPQHHTTARLRQAKTEHEEWVERALGDIPAQPAVHDQSSGTVNGSMLQAGNVLPGGRGSAQSTTNSNIDRDVHGISIMRRDFSGDISIKQASGESWRMGDFGASDLSVALPENMVGHQLRGRDDLLMELTALVNTIGGRVVLCGAGGCGKSAVAYAIADKVRAQRTVWWVDGTTRDTLVSGLFEVAIQAGTPRVEAREVWRFPAVVAN